MAASDKNIVITPQRGSATLQPTIVFTGDGNDPITLRVLDSTIGTLSFEGSAGQLMGISDSLASGSIFSVNYISGLPAIDVNASGTISLAPTVGRIGIGTTTPEYTLDVNGKANFSNNIKITPTSEAWAEGLQFYMPNTSTWGGVRWVRNRTNFHGSWYQGWTALDSSNDMVFGHNASGTQIDNILRLYGSASGSARIGRDLYITGLIGGNYANRLVVGNTDTSYTLQDGNLRPTIQAHGAYPVLSLNHTITSNASHGPTLQFTCNGTGHQFVIGTTGNGTRLDIGFSAAADWNPHNGIAGYNGTTSMSFATSGNVGIGSTNPTSKLDISGSCKIGGAVSRSVSGLTVGFTNNTAFTVNADIDDSGRMLSIVNESNTTNAMATLGFRVSPGSPTTNAMLDIKFVQTGATNTSSLYYSFNHGGSFNDRFLFKSDGTFRVGGVIREVPYDTLNNGTLSWEGSAGQLFSITNNLTSGSIFSVNDISGIPSIDVDANGTIELAPFGGNVGIGTTNPTTKLHVIGDILASGNVTAYSDLQLKDNVETIDKPLEKVLGLRGVTFTRVDIEDRDKKHVGVIAQEVEAILPEAVQEHANGIKSVAYGNMVGLLIEAIKEQQSQIETLKAEIESLKRG